MCPACYAATVWLVAGATSAGGLTSFVAAKVYKKSRAKKRSGPVQNAQIATPKVASEDALDAERMKTPRPRKGSCKNSD